MAPLDVQWNAIEKNNWSEPQIDIIIPVYNQYDITLNCIFNVLSSFNHTKYELIIIDDCSTDIRLSSKLKELSANGLFTLLYNRSNLGFTKTVNRGMQLHVNRDVILLNSDTVTFNNWVDRLHAVAYENERYGTVNPLTNASHISGYPSAGVNDSSLLEVDGFTLDILASTVNKGRNIQVPTTVGFCMYIKRICLDEIGYFDEIRFPRGYGEESDFCYRARRLGWKHVVAGNVFVIHYEGISFGNEKELLKKKMLEAFNELHPETGLVDQNLKLDDPTRSLRAQLDFARVIKFIGSDTIFHFYISNDDSNIKSYTKAYIELDASDHNIFSVYVDGLNHIPNLKNYDMRWGFDLGLFNKFGSNLLSKIWKQPFEEGEGL